MPNGTDKNRPEVLPDAAPPGAAGAFVLRLMSPEDETAFAAAAAEDPGLAARVAAWHERFLPLAQSVPPVQPPASAWREIEQTVFLRPRRRLTLSLGLAGLAVLLLAALVWITTPEAADPATLSARVETRTVSGPLVVSVNWHARHRTLDVHREAGELPPGRALQLWLVPPDGAPISLGLLPPHPDARFILRAERAALLDGATLAISNEPAGGSPLATPSGVVLGTAPLTPLPELR